MQFKMYLSYEDLQYILKFFKEIKGRECELVPLYITNPKKIENLLYEGKITTEDIRKNGWDYYLKKYGCLKL